MFYQFTMRLNFIKPLSQTFFLLMFLASCDSDTEIETVEGSLESPDAQATLAAPPMSEIITENAQAIKEVSSSLDDLDGSIQKNTQAIEKLSADLATGDNSSLTSLNTQSLGANSSSSQTTSLPNSEGQAVNIINCLIL